jgi:hypothetical protein
MAGEVYVGLSREASTRYSKLPDPHRTIVDARLRELAKDPERAPVRALSPQGRTIYVALAVVDDERAWAYRIEYVQDTLMRDRGGLPSIAVLRARPIRR